MTDAIYRPPVKDVARLRARAGLYGALLLKSFTYEEILQRDKVSLDVFWLKDESLEDSANLPAPEVLAQEIAENLEAALRQFSGIYEALTTAAD